MDYRYTYLVGNIMLLVVWAFFFLKRKDLRREMITMSLIMAPFGPLSELWYTKDYWQPQTLFGWKIGFEDIMFAFGIGGLASVIYEEILSKKIGKRHLRKQNWFFGLFALIVLTSMFFFNDILNVNSIYASYIGFFIFAMIILIQRRDLITDSLMSGLFLSLLALLVYLVYLAWFPGVIQSWWILQNVSGILILGVPLEELLWFFAWGMVWGPMYEFLMGLRLVKNK